MPTCQPEVPSSKITLHYAQLKTNNTNKNHSNQFRKQEGRGLQAFIEYELNKKQQAEHDTYF